MKTILCSALFVFCTGVFAGDLCYEEFCLKKVLIAIRDAEGVGKDSLPFLCDLNFALDSLASLGENNRKNLDMISLQLLKRYQEIEASKKSPIDAQPDLQLYLMVGVLTTNAKANPFVPRIAFNVEEFLNFKSDIVITRARAISPMVSGAGPDIARASDLAEWVFSNPDPRFTLTADEIRLVYMTSKFLESWDWKREARTFQIAAALAMGRASIEPGKRITSAK